MKWAGQNSNLQSLHRLRRKSELLHWGWLKPEQTTDRQWNCQNLHLHATEHDAIASPCKWNTEINKHNGYKDLQNATKTFIIDETECIVLKNIPIVLDTKWTRVALSLSHLCNRIRSTRKTFYQCRYHSAQASLIIKSGKHAQILIHTWSINPVNSVHARSRDSNSRATLIRGFRASISKGVFKRKKYFFHTFVTDIVLAGKDQWMGKQFLACWADKLSFNTLNGNLHDRKREKQL